MLQGNNAKIYSHHGNLYNDKPNKLDGGFPYLNIVRKNSTNKKNNYALFFLYYSIQNSLSKFECQTVFHPTTTQ